MKKLLLIIVALVWSAAAAFASNKCAQLSTVMEHLYDEYGETLQSMALTQDGQAAVQTYANPRTGTWTFVATNTEGLTCIVSSGTEWESYVGTPT